MDAKILKKQNKIHNTLMKFGGVMCFDPSNFERPIAINKTLDFVADDLIAYVKQNKKYIDKQFVYVILGIGYGSMYIVFKYAYVSKEYKSIIEPKCGNTVWISIEYMKKYGFHLSDLKYIHKAFQKKSVLSNRLLKVTIEQIYETLGIKPKKVKTELKFVYPELYEIRMNKIKQTLKKNGRQRFYVPYNFDFPAASSDDIQVATKQIKKNASKENKVFHVMITQKEHEIRVKCNEYKMGERLMKTGMGTVVVFNDEYLINFGFRFIDIEKIYFVLVKHAEVSKKKQVSMQEIDKLFNAWSDGLRKG